MIGVYAIVHEPTNRSYIGSAINIKRRFKEHKILLRKGLHHSPYLQNVWNKYGESQFVFKVLKHLESLHEARSLEQAMLDCFYPKVLNASNTATGFPCGDSHHSKKADFHMKFVMQKLSEEERKARYGKTKGTTRSSEPYIVGAAKRLSDPNYRQKLSDACKGKREIVECPYCKLKGGGANMQRYHFENCKDKK